MVDCYDCQCNRCNYQWKTTEIPKACAKCKSRVWNKERKRKMNKRGGVIAYLFWITVGIVIGFILAMIFLK